MIDASWTLVNETVLSDAGGHALGEVAGAGATAGGVTSAGGGEGYSDADASGWHTAGAGEGADVEIAMLEYATCRYGLLTLLDRMLSV